MVAQPQDGDSKSDVPAADSKTGGLFDLKGLPNWLKAIGYAVTLAVTAYPIYLGIATLQEKRAESLREAAREEQRRNDEEVRKKKMDLDAAQASEREAALRLDIVKEEGRDKLAVAQQEAQDRERVREEERAKEEREYRNLQSKALQEQLDHVLDTPVEHLASEIAGLSKFFGGSAEQRSAILMTLEARLQAARSPIEVNAVFSAFRYIGTFDPQGVFSLVLRANQDAFAAIPSALRTDSLGHHGDRDATYRDIVDAFSVSTTSRYLATLTSVEESTVDRQLAASSTVDQAKEAHLRLLVEFAKLRASRDAVVALLPLLRSSHVTIQRCFLPDAVFTSAPELKELKFRASFLVDSDLRQLPQITAIRLEDLIDPITSGGLAAPLSKKEAVEIALKRAAIEYRPEQLISVENSPQHWR